VETPRHRADALFALPRLPRTIGIVGSLPGWREDLAELGMETLDGEPGAWSPTPDVVVSDSAGLAQSLPTGAAALVVDGDRRVGRRLRRRGLATVQLLPLPVAGSPVAYLDLEHRRAASYGIAEGIVHGERWRMARNRVASELARLGLFPPPRRLVTLAGARAGPPAFVAAAAELGVARDVGWLMLVSSGSVVRRNAFLLFPPGAIAPRHVIRFARVRDLAQPFERDARAAELVAATGGVVAQRAPRFLGRIEVDGYHAALESAATGAKLAVLLRRPIARTRKLAVLEAIARWLIDVARQTAAPPAALAAERTRLARDVVSYWSDRGVGPDLVESLAPVPATFRHNDVAEENVVVDRDRFSVLDWEFAQPVGLPLGDLVYFAVRTLRIADGAFTEQERDRHFVELLSGRAESSPILFRWIRELVEALSIGPEAVGAIVTLDWLDRGKLSVDGRHRAEAVGGSRLAPDFAERAAHAWLGDPALGSTWDRWRS
jgi:hypothetical protein